MGAITTHTHDIAGCDEPDMMSRKRDFSEMRKGELKVQEGPFVHVGMEYTQKDNCWVTSTHEGFEKYLKRIPTSPGL